MLEYFNDFNYLGLADSLSKSFQLSDDLNRHLKIWFCQLIHRFRLYHVFSKFSCWKFVQKWSLVENELETRFLRVPSRPLIWTLTNKPKWLKMKKTRGTWSNSVYMVATDNCLTIPQSSISFQTYFRMVFRKFFLNHYFSKFRNYYICSNLVTKKLAQL